MSGEQKAEVICCLAKWLFSITLKSRMFENVFEGAILSSAISCAEYELRL